MMSAAMPAMPEWKKRLLHPYAILLIAAVLPGFGHVLLGQPRRGLIMQIFMIVLGIVTWHLTTPEQSLVGRLAGGLFIYAISVMEAYRLARLRQAATPH
jgi:hypothetical protein